MKCNHPYGEGATCDRLQGHPGRCSAAWDQLPAEDMQAEVKRLRGVLRTMADNADAAGESHRQLGNLGAPTLAANVKEMCLEALGEVA